VAVENGADRFGAVRARARLEKGSVRGLAAALPSLPSASGVETGSSRPAARRHRRERRLGAARPDRRFTDAKMETLISLSTTCEGVDFFVGAGTHWSQRDAFERCLATVSSS
jgi:hypothetical protein